MRGLTAFIKIIWIISMLSEKARHRVRNFSLMRLIVIVSLLLPMSSISLTLYDITVIQPHNQAVLESQINAKARAIMDVLQGGDASWFKRPEDLYATTFNRAATSTVVIGHRVEITLCRPRAVIDQSLISAGWMVLSQNSTAVCYTSTGSGP